MLVTRALVGILAVPLAILVVYSGGLPLLASLLVLAILGLHEFYRMTRHYRPHLLAGYLGAVFILWGAYSSQMAGVLRGVVLLFLFTFLLHALRGMNADMVSQMAVTFFGSVYVGVGFAYMILLRSPEYGISLAIVVLLATWTSDTVAYAVGHFYGQRRISPVVSPNKTLEGTAAGLLGTVLVVLVAGKSLGWMESWQFFVLGLVIAVAAPMGDFFESYLKRSVNVKDAGNIIPGHGGVLDRFDSLLFAAPAAYYLVLMLAGSG